MHEELDEQRKAEQKGKQPRITRELFAEANNAAESWRIFKIIAEFVVGFEELQKYDLAVTFFGSARCGFGDKVYRETTELAARLTRDGFAVITGGGGGVMEAANKGAYEAGGKSIGLNIELSKGQAVNQYVTVAKEFHYFFTRKVMLSFASEVYVFMPGGFGTLDEFFELVTLVQTKKIPRIPIILLDREYWKPLLAWIREDLYVNARAIDEEDMGIYSVCDSVDEAHQLILEKTKDIRERLLRGSA